MTPLRPKRQDLVKQPAQAEHSGKSSAAIKEPTCLTNLQIARILLKLGADVGAFAAPVPNAPHSKRPLSMSVLIVLISFTYCFIWW